MALKIKGNVIYLTTNLTRQRDVDALGRISIAGNAFKPTDLSEVLTEIKKIDIDFSSEKFINDCRYLFIPNILEVSCYQMAVASLALDISIGHFA